MGIQRSRARPQDRSWHVHALIEGSLPDEFLLDSGATHSVISVDTYSAIPVTQRPALIDVNKGEAVRGFDGNTTQIVGNIFLEFSLAGHTFQWKFLVANAKCGNILGIDFMSHHKVFFDYEQDLVWCSETIPMRASVVTPAQSIQAVSYTHLTLPTIYSV